MIRSPLVLVVGLTGGIGAGKSTVSRLLASHGAVIVDADVIARQVVEPDGPAYQGVVDRFGSGVLLTDGHLDRARLAEIVFADAGALADHVVILDVPLLVESGRSNTAGTIVVDCPPEEALRRAVARGLAEEDVRRRMANQVSREERLAKADFVVDNSGSESALPAEVDRLWSWIESLQSADAPSG